MGEMRRISVDLNGTEAELVDRLLAEQRFSDGDEVLHYALRLLRDWIVEQDEGDRVFAENYTPEEIRLHLGRRHCERTADRGQL